MTRNVTDTTHQPHNTEPGPEPAREPERAARKRPGPVRRLDTRQYVVMLEEEPAEWAKRQPGGLSDLVRRLLRQAYEQSHEPFADDEHAVAGSAGKSSAVPAVPGVHG